MAWRIDDRWLWVGLGAITFFAVKGVGYALREILHLTQIHEEPQKQICAISQDTEDALDAGSLTVLAQSHDRAIRDSATKILADRFLRDQTAITSLTRDIYSPNPSIHARAQVLRKLLERFASDAGNIQFLSETSNPIDDTHYRISGGGWTTSRLREHEESFEEQELRRRRREAVVFNEGGPVRQDDIIQRGVNGAPVPARRRNEDETRMLESMMSQVTAGNNADAAAE